MPRAKFIKIMFFDLISVCVSASLCCLAVFCAVKARENNTAPDARDSYSSDACAVAAIWLIFMIWYDEVSLPRILMMLTLLLGAQTRFVL
jgi:hypothetical protein